ncbi:MAG: FkbM family methyltransferase [Stigonema ocellatum SAG 48.90 = DSM 106950]|nr:FkbM family methyltransferase [Stigonema ocellatum SAG 48.90 = DSM 106950]
MFQTLKKAGRRCKKAIASFYTSLLLEEQPTYHKFCFSQEGEDMILSRIFGAKRNGFYIDVGAFHPQYLSNTYFFYQSGWRGINIDAMPGSMEVFKKIRPNDINLEIAVSNTKEVLNYFAFNIPNLNGFSHDISLKRDGWKGEDWEAKVINQMEIQTYTLAEILEKYLPEKQTIDFINVDVEGLDYQVLVSNDWSRYRPNIVLVEDLELTSINTVQTSKNYQFMCNQGYELYSKSVNTLIFKLEEFKVET